MRTGHGRRQRLAAGAEKRAVASTRTGGQWNRRFAAGAEKGLAVALHTGQGRERRLAAGAEKGGGSHWEKADRGKQTSWGIMQQHVRGSGRRWRDSKV
eukprot:300000-Chlamydomonas_euryale.AAC.1